MASSSSRTGEGPPPKKRPCHRQPLSCLYVPSPCTRYRFRAPRRQCRQRKAKCDRENPCATCRQRGEHCLYEARDIRDTDPLSEYAAIINNLRARVEVLERANKDVPVASTSKVAQRPDAMRPSGPSSTPIALAEAPMPTTEDAALLLEEQAMGDARADRDHFGPSVDRAGSVAGSPVCVNTRPSRPTTIFRPTLDASLSASPTTLLDHVPPLYVAQRYLRSFLAELWSVRPLHRFFRSRVDKRRSRFFTRQRSSPRWTSSRHASAIR
jgi:hypothetical protein